MSRILITIVRGRVFRDSGTLGTKAWRQVSVGLFWAGLIVSFLSLGFMGLFSEGVKYMKI